MARNKGREHFRKALLLEIECEGIEADDDILFHWDSAINLPFLQR